MQTLRFLLLGLHQNASCRVLGTQGVWGYCIARHVSFSRCCGLHFVLWHSFAGVVVTWFHLNGLRMYVFSRRIVFSSQLLYSECTYVLDTIVPKGKTKQIL
uniref:Uncharacterized protein n=1 Tax=Ixodes ricinus TaxID=34613 RepID=A0A6B0U913_IXORI